MFKKKGMTLIELLAVIAIIAILFILLIPQINSAIEKSRISGVQTDFHSYEVAARGYLMEVGDGEKTEEGLNKFLDKNLKSNGGEATEKGPWGKPYKIKVDNEKKQFVFTTLDKNKEPRTHKMIVSWGDDEIKSKYTVGNDDIENTEEISEDQKNTLCESRTIEETDESYFTTVDVEGGISITAYSNDGPKDVVIPCQIGGKNVVDIGAIDNVGAFQSKSIKSAILPNSLKTISGNHAFYDNELTIVTIPQSVTNIGEFAFSYNEIATLTLPNNLNTIEDSVFSHNKIVQLSLSNNISVIRSSAFAYNEILNLTIPDNVTVIEQSAFRNNKINDLTIGSGITRIDNSTFKNNQLTTIILPNNLTSVGYAAFYENPNLKTVLNKTSISNITLAGGFDSSPTITN